MRRSGRLTYANVVATLALFMALGGVSYAAITITGKNVKNGSLTGADVKNKSLTKKDFRGSVRGATGATGATGAAGAKGDAGQQGPAGLAGAKGDAGQEGPAGLAGAPGATNVTLRSTTTSVGAGTRGQATAVCEPGERATGGGAFMFSPSANTVLIYSHPGTADDIVAPTGTPDRWRASVSNGEGSARDLRVWVICAAP